MTSMDEQLMVSFSFSLFLVLSLSLSLSLPLARTEPLLACTLPLWRTGQVRDYLKNPNDPQYLTSVQVQQYITLQKQSPVLTKAVRAAISTKPETFTAVSKAFAANAQVPASDEAKSLVALRKCLINLHA